jgi:hypothetical protein
MEKNNTPGMRPLPTLAELHNDVHSAFKNDQLNSLLNQPPHASWVKKFPAVMKIEGEYMPIDKVDFMLKRIFGRTKIEVRSVQQVLNSMVVTLRIHYKDPITGEWDFQDGVGATPLQVDSGQPASNINALKRTAVQIATPIAKSAAKKDAAEELGALFGRDLNRKDTIMFAGAYGVDEPPAPAQTNAAPVLNISGKWQQPSSPYGELPDQVPNNHSQPFNLSAL